MTMAELLTGSRKTYGLNRLLVFAAIFSKSNVCKC